MAREQLTAAVDPSLVLELEPAAIVLLLRGIAKARADVAVFEAIVAKAPKAGEDSAAAFVEKNRAVRAILQESAATFRLLMTELGVTEIPTFKLLVQYPDDLLIHLREVSTTQGP